MSGPVYLYAFGPDDGPFKVGFSTRPHARARQFLGLDPGRTLAPAGGRFHRLVPLASAGDAEDAEGMAHRLLARHRVEGEWFGAGRDAVLLALAAVAACHPSAGAATDGPFPWVPVPTSRTGRTAVIALKLPPATRAGLRRAADADGRTPGWIINHAASEWLVARGYLPEPEGPPRKPKRAKAGAGGAAPDAAAPGRTVPEAGQ